MMDLVAAIMDAVTKRLNVSTSLATILSLLSIVVSPITVFLQSCGAKALSCLAHFMPPVDTLTHASAGADFLSWISRKLLMLLLALSTGASIAIACGYASHAALAAMFGDRGHISDHQTVEIYLLFILTMLLAYDIPYCLYRNLQHRIPVLQELHKVHHSTEVMVDATKDRVHPIHDVMNRVWDGLITGPAYGVRLFFAFDPVELTILGINASVLRNIISMDFARHTYLKVSLGPLVNQIIMCLHYHQLHHSANLKHFGKNFGLMSSIWSKMSGTLRVPEPNEGFSFGLGSENRGYQSAFGLNSLPLRKVGRLLRPERAEALLRAAAPVQFGTTQLAIISR